MVNSDKYFAKKELKKAKRLRNFCIFGGVVSAVGAIKSYQLFMDSGYSLSYAYNIFNFVLGSYLAPKFFEKAKEEKEEIEYNKSLLNYSKEPRLEEITFM